VNKVKYPYKKKRQETREKISWYPSSISIILYLILKFPGWIFELISWRKKKLNPSGLINT